MRVGEIAVLNSGGPPMTILFMTGDGWALCEWPHKEAKLYAAFPVKCLRAPADPKPPVFILDKPWRDELGIWTPEASTPLMDDEWPDEIG